MKATIKNSIITEHVRKQMEILELNKRQLFSIINYPTKRYRYEKETETKSKIKNKIISVFYIEQCKEIKIIKLKESENWNIESIY